MESLVNLIKNIASINVVEKKYLELCKVLSIDKLNNSVDLISIDTDQKYVDVPLSISENSNNVIYPQQDSIVLISFINDSNPIVVMIDNAEQIVSGIKVDNQDLTLKIILNFFVDSNKKLMESMFDALKQATYNSAVGPTTPSPNNQTVFDNILQTYTDELQQTADDLQKLYYK